MIFGEDYGTSAILLSNAARDATFSFTKGLLEHVIICFFKE